jgi:hypothetical protein
LGNLYGLWTQLVDKISQLGLWVDSGFLPAGDPVEAKSEQAQT